MSRRPHWTDDLIEAVKDAISGWCFDHVEGPLYDEDVYPVIAAVEDWHKAKRDSRDRTHSAECWRWHQECAEHLIERQRSTAQRVRDVTVPVPGDVYDLDSYTRGAADALALTNKALDGDSDE